MINLLLAMLTVLSAHAVAATNAGDGPNVDNMTTAVFQVPGLSSENFHPSILISHNNIDEIAKSLGQVYQNIAASDVRNLPREIKVLIPDSMNEQEATAYLAKVQQSFRNGSTAAMPLVLVRVPVTRILSEGEKILRENSSESTNAGADPARKRFFSALRAKLKDLATWARNMRNWRQWWQSKTTLQKDQAILAMFGARGGVTTAILANEAGASVANIVRMTITFAADVFFSVAPQTLAKIPEKIHIPGAGDWFNKNTELKAFLFNYAMGLGISLGFMNLGYWATGAFNPWNWDFLLKFAGLQVIDGAMSTLGSRGAVTLARKGYISGRKENAFYAILNLIGQFQGIGAWSGNMGVYGLCLAVKSALQGITFFASRVLPPKTPNIFLFHADIPEEERKSILYVEGLDPLKAQSLEGLEEVVRSVTPGPTGINRILSKLRGFINVKRWKSISKEGRDAPLIEQGSEVRRLAPPRCEALFTSSAA